VQLGVEVLSEKDAFVHVSGHPARDELTRLYQWVRPKVAIPVHGELRHLNEHATLARAVQVPEAIVAPNGTLVRLAPGTAEIVDHIPTGRLGLDGSRMIRLDTYSLRPRKQMIFNGAATITLVADARGKLLTAPRLSVHGFPEGEDLEEIENEAVAAVAKAFEDGPIRDDNSASMLASQAVRRVFKARLGKRPVTDVQIVRI
jgi:ribonuclease J